MKLTKRVRRWIILLIVFLTATSVLFVVRRKSLTPDELKAISDTIGFQIPQRSHGRVWFKSGDGLPNMSVWFECDKEAADQMISSSWLATCKRGCYYCFDMHRLCPDIESSDRTFHKTFEPMGHCSVLLRSVGDRMQVYVLFDAPDKYWASEVEAAIEQPVYIEKIPFRLMPTQERPWFVRRWN